MAFDQRGATVGVNLRTTNARIYAAGDVASRVQFTHAADAMARIAIQNALFCGRKKASALVIAWCTSTEPEAAHVGLDTAAGRVRPPTMKCDKPDDPRCIQGQSAAVTAIPGVVFSGATNGVMRAYSTTDGNVIWEHDTARDYQTLNGFKAKGGVIDGPGPTVVNGVVYMNSGYSTTRGGVPGNVMLAFSVPKP